MKPGWYIEASCRRLGQTVSRPALRRTEESMIPFVLTLLSGTVFYRGVEGWSLLDSLYFSVVTLTSYGDLAPSTPLSKIFTIVYLFVGIGLILGFIDAVSKRAMEIRGERRRRDREPQREERDRDQGS